MSKPSKQSKGGAARARKLSSARRSEIARAASGARWGLLPVTHEGALRLASVDLPCAMLEDGSRVIAIDALVNALGLSALGTAPEQALDLVLKPEPATVRYRSQRGSVTRGLRAEELPRLLEALLRAKQPELQQARNLAGAMVLALARAGVAPLIDEATGYAAEGHRGSLTELLAASLPENLGQWVRVLPPDYFKHLCRLRGLPHRPDMPLPADFGALTANLVFDRLPAHVLEALRQSPSRADPHPMLMQHIGLVVGLMRVAKDWATFMTFLDDAAPAR